LSELPYDEVALVLEPGSRLYLYSDGIPEALNPDGHTFGGARLLRALEQARAEPLERGVAALLEEIQHWSGRAGPRDDASIVAVEFLGTLDPKAGVAARSPRPE